MSISHGYRSEKRYICRIEEDFSSTVGEQKEKFEQHLHCELLAQVDLQIPRRMIQDIDVSPGKIIHGTLLLHSLPPPLLPLLPSSSPPPLTPPFPLPVIKQDDCRTVNWLYFLQSEIVHTMYC
jgi:hypothetical protein